MTQPMHGVLSEGHGYTGSPGFDHALRDCNCMLDWMAWYAPQKRNLQEEQRRDAMLGSLLGDVIGGLTDPNSPLAEAEAALSHADKVRGACGCGTGPGRNGRDREIGDKEVEQVCW